jgi:hypothetical protein
LPVEYTTNIDASDKLNKIRAMDKLIEDYKQELINDDNGGYGYPAGLKAKIIKEVENNDFSIPVKRVQEMIESVRGQKAETEERQLTIPDVSNQRELLIAFMHWINEGDICERDTTYQTDVDEFLSNL